MPFKNVDNFANIGISNNLELNLKYWIEDSMLRIGGYILDQYSVLKPDNSEGSINLSIWNSEVQGWAYKIVEGGVRGNTVITPAQIYVNGIPETDVIINYAKGQITFNRELNELDIVTARHNTNRINIVTIQDLPVRPIVKLGSAEGLSTVYHELAASQTLKTPYIIIESFPTSSAAPRMLGSGQVWATDRIQMNVTTESIAELSRILNILRVQSFKSTRVFDTNQAAIDGVLPIDANGDINPRGIQYPDILRKYYVDTMYWKQIGVRKFKTNKEDIQLGMVYFTVEIPSNPKF